MKRFVLLAALLTLPVPALAQRVSQLPTVTPSGRLETGIAAVVNDSVITTTDLEQRMKLAILSSGFPDNANVRSHLLPQILRSQIDEQLQAQEAKRLGLSVSSDEIDQALSHIAQDNKIQGDIRGFIASHGGSSSALEAQIRNSLLWNKVVQRELRPRVEVGDEEVDAVVDRIRADAGKKEYLVSEIFLAVDNPKDEDQVKQVAEDLVGKIRSGTNFPAVARQFSQGTGAIQGGDIGWIQQGQLSPVLNRVLAASDVGKISDPIRTSNGYHILGIRDRRTVALGDPDKASISLMQFFRPYAGANKDAVKQEAGRLRTRIKSCVDPNSLLVNFPHWTAQRLGDLNPSKAPAWIVDKVNKISSGSASEVLSTDKGAALLFVCSRNDGGEVDREAIIHSIGTEKMELQARRLLRDLRRDDAYLDVRLGRGS